ncbi:MAG: hypothetical protein JNM93_07625 [Bacteriovoracaceae bacterium]|nr:hypothetical protein [Bacteriovoracaceae bacterium]
MVEVTKEQFYQYVNPRDICLHSEKEITYWKTRNGLMIGQTDGFNRTDEKKFYMLTEAAYAELIKDQEKS